MSIKCRSVLCLVFLTLCAGIQLQAQEGVAGLYAQLLQARGADYLAQRGAFLSTTGAADFLTTTEQDHPEDFLVLALLFRLNNAALAQRYDEHLPTAKDDYFDRDGLNDGLFDGLAYNKSNFANWPVLSSQAVEAAGGEMFVNRFLFLENFVFNPQSYSQSYRTWALFDALDHLWFPLNADELSRLKAQSVSSSGLPLYAEQLNKIDVNQYHGWLQYALKLSRPDEQDIQLMLAAQLYAPEGDALLISLSQEKGMTGFLGAMLYAGCLPDDGFTRHSFKANWLEKWVQRASPDQLQAAEVYYLSQGKYDLLKEKGMLPKFGMSFPVNLMIKSTDLIMGLFLLHHKDSLSHSFQEEYREDVENSVLSFCYTMARDAADITDPSREISYRSSMAELVMSPLWPEEFRAKVAALPAISVEAKKMRQQALETMGKIEYPNGEQLQAIVDDLLLVTDKSKPWKP